MMRRDIDGTYPLLFAQLLQLLHVNAAFILSHTQHFGSARFERLACWRVSQMLDDNTIIGSRQYTRRQKNAHLTTAHHANMVNSHMQTSLHIEHGGNGFT